MPGIECKATSGNHECAKSLESRGPMQSRYFALWYFRGSKTKLINILFREHHNITQQNVIADNLFFAQPTRVEFLSAGFQFAGGHCFGNPDRQIPEIDGVP